jgi:ATP-dependent exoDNAse (exonuclease V) beta subunit
MSEIVVTFDDKNHKYFDNLGREYISVTRLIHSERPEFDALEIAKKVTRIQGSKYYQMSVHEVVQKWANSAPLGTSLHGKVEQYINEKVITEDKLFRPCVEQFAKLKFTGKLMSEKLVFDEDLLLAGTVDLLEDTGDDPLYLYDIKSSTSNKNGEMAKEKLDDYTLQLNLYKMLVEKRFGRPCKIIGILWFKDFADMKEKTKLTIVPIKENKSYLYSILQKRRLQVRYGV